MRLKERTRGSTSFSKDSVIPESQISTTKEGEEVTMRKIEKRLSSTRRESARNDMKTIRDAGQEVSETTTIVMIHLNWVGKVMGLTMT